MFFNGVLSLFEREGYLGIFYWSQTTFDNGKYTCIALSYYILYDKNMSTEREIWHSRPPREKWFVFLLVSNRNTFKYNDFDFTV